MRRDNSVPDREDLWLALHLQGTPTTAIASRYRVSRRAVQLGIQRAKLRMLGNAIAGRQPRPPVLIPLFPIAAFTPASTCPHHGPIQVGSPFCCMVCNKSGMDDHPALKRDPRTDPKPEPKPPQPPPRNKPTRRQRRAGRQS
jgi:hypothetical protein